MTQHQDLASYWWVIWIAIMFGGSVLAFVGEQFDVGITALRRRARRKRQHQLKLRKLELEIARAKAANPVAAIAPPKPGPCVHRQVTPVVSVTDEVVAWLCKNCSTKLPADWAVREEDL